MPIQPTTKVSLGEFDLLFYIGTDGKPVLEIMTERMPVNDGDEPDCRIWLNEALIHNGTELEELPQ